MAISRRNHSTPYTAESPQALGSKVPRRRIRGASFLFWIFGSLLAIAVIFAVYSPS